jgi:replicative DNA helicase
MAGSGRTITGLSSGFFDLDEMTSGLQAGELLIVAARPSMGKTAFALNLAEQVAFGGQPHAPGGAQTPVGFFSMEMSRQSVTQRVLCAHSGVDSHKMRKNLLGKEDFSRLAQSCGQLAEAPIFIDDTPGLTVMLLRAKARRMVQQHRIRCLFIDYLQLMTAPSAAKESRQAEVSAISRGIKALARELEIPIVCLSQLNRGAEQREGHRPRMADLRESGSIEQDADVIMLLHREEYYHQHEPGWANENPDKCGVAEVIIAKQRNGPTGTVDLTWDASTTRFKNLARGGSWASSPSGPAQGEQSSPAVVRRIGFAPGKKVGPESGFRDGGGPDARQDWQDQGIDDLPI